MGEMNDVTETVQRGEALRWSEEKYQTIFNELNDGILVQDFNSNEILNINAGMEELFGYKLEELKILKTDVLCADPPFDAESAAKMIKRAFDSGPQLFDWLARHKDGSLLWVEVSLKKFLLGGRECLLAVIRDVTSRRQMESRLERYERLSLIGEMAANIGHEIRNPMTSVRGFLQMLGSKENLFEYNDYFELMIGELDRANAIISEYLSLASDRPVRLKKMNINDVIQALVPLLQADAVATGKNIRVNTGNVPDVYLDEKEIRQLLLNLVRNGLEAMCPGETLTIGTCFEEGELVLSVLDQGKGIEPALLNKIGTPFFTTKEQGTGLGLAVCCSIATRHNAAIDVDTGPDGTAFFVRFRPVEVNQYNQGEVG